MHHPLNASSAQIQVWTRLGAAMAECLATLGAPAYAELQIEALKGAETDEHGTLTLCGALDVTDALVRATVETRRALCPYGNGNCPAIHEPMGLGHHRVCSESRADDTLI